MRHVDSCFLVFLFSMTAGCGESDPNLLEATELIEEEHTVSAASVCSSRAYFYEHNDYKGKVFYPQDRGCQNIPSSINDEISSYKIGNCAVELYKDSGCRNLFYVAPAHSYRTQMPSGLNDEISSIRIR
ncbi:MAG TPA: hypothetical protein DCQ33_13945 [Nitrospira sp.]|nr:hypothetical protein [Nitrospira sp.]